MFQPKLLLIVCACLILSLGSIAQTLTPLTSARMGDNSYYDIAEVSPGRMWAAGEQGLLAEIDVNGVVTPITVPDARINILKILPTEEAIFLGGDNGTILRYDRTKENFIASSFGKEFEKKCFYDLMLLDDGTLLAAGGHQKISKAEKTLPK
ncbi:MAG: hypothetical protein AAF206_15300, partial [Bacteroidota bacterium]